jgi:putative Holliday junction resolvase
MPEASKRSQPLLGFDYGERRIGVAVGYLETGHTHPLTTLIARNDQPDWDEVSRLLQEWKPKALVLGLPLNMDGSDNPMTAKARKFGNRLNGRYNLPVHMVDERLTTHLASQALFNSGVSASKQRSVIDQLAAQQILQTYITEQPLNDNDKNGEPGLGPEH